jgi:hypothetical protein
MNPKYSVFTNRDIFIKSDVRNEATIDLVITEIKTSLLLTICINVMYIYVVKKLVKISVEALTDGQC